MTDTSRQILEAYYLFKNPAKSYEPIYSSNPLLFVSALLDFVQPSNCDDFSGPFISGVKFLISYKPNVAAEMMKVIAETTSYNYLIEIYANTPLKTEMVSIFADALRSDMAVLDSQDPAVTLTATSHAAKVFPRERSSLDKKYGLVKEITKQLGVNKEYYRKHIINPLKKRILDWSPFTCYRDDITYIVDATADCGKNQLVTVENYTKIPLLVNEGVNFLNYDLAPCSTMSFNLDGMESSRMFTHGDEITTPYTIVFSNGDVADKIPMKEYNTIILYVNVDRDYQTEFPVKYCENVYTYEGIDSTLEYIINYSNNPVMDTHELNLPTELTALLKK